MSISELIKESVSNVSSNEHMLYCPICNEVTEHTVASYGDNEGLSVYPPVSRCRICGLEKTPMSLSALETTVALE